MAYRETMTDKLTDRIEQYLNSVTNYSSISHGSAVQLLRVALTEINSLACELLRSQKDNSDWKRMAGECCKLFNCPDKPESGLSCNLPNLIRDELQKPTLPRVNSPDEIEMRRWYLVEGRPAQAGIVIFNDADKKDVIIFNGLHMDAKYYIDYFEVYGPIPEIEGE
jgi:hypothetical protein